MPPQDDSTGGSVQSYAEQWVAETPFVSTPTTVLENPEATEEPMQVSRFYEAASPFRDSQETVEGSPEAEDFVQLLAELEDEEFDEAVKGLANEASELYREQFVGEDSALVPQSAETERLLEAHFEPLVNEAEALLDEMARGIERYDLLAMSETEIENLL